MIQKILILGLIKQKPRYGYEIKKVIENEFGIFSSLNSVSIYYPLRIMEKEGLIKKASARGQKNLNRYVYQITSKGEKQLNRLLLDNLLSERRPFLEVDISLYFLSLLNKDDVLRRMRLRAIFLEKVKKWLTEKLPSYEDKMHLKILLRHHLNLASAEEEFVREIIALLKKQPANKAG